MDLKEYHQYNPYYVDSMITGVTLNSYEQFIQRIYSLPKNIQSYFLNSLETAEFIKNMVDANNLTERQGQELARIVRDLLFADLYLGNIINQIKQKINIDETKAKTIAGLILTKLFAPILEDLKKIHIDKFARGQSVQQSNQAPMQNDDRVVNLKNQ